MSSAVLYIVPNLFILLNRYRSMTKQFFRKADGVVLMYDVTVETSFKAITPWVLNIQVGKVTCKPTSNWVLWFVLQVFLFSYLVLNEV